MSALLLAEGEGKTRVRLEYRWYDIRKEACALVDPFCSPGLVRHVPGCDEARRFRAIKNEEDLAEIEELYRHLSNEMVRGYDADIALCLLFRDAYFAWG